MAQRYEITGTVQQTGAASVRYVANASVQVKDLQGNNLTVYAAETGSSTLTNPLTADVAGRVDGWVEAPDFDLTMSGSGVTSYTQKVRQSAAGTFNVKSYGARPGVASSTAINAALTAASTYGTTAGRQAVVDLGGSSYVIDTVLTVSSNVELRNGTLDFSAQATTFSAITLTGTLASGLALTADSTEGAYTATVASTATLAAGDWIKVDSTAAWGETSLKGEFNQVRVVTSGTVATCYQPFADTYTTVTTGTIYKTAFVENVTFRDLLLLGPTDTSLAIQGITATLCRNLTFDNCRFWRTNFIGINLTDCVDVRVRGCSFRDIFKSGLAYGIEVAWGCQDVSIVGCHAENMRHAVTLGGGLSRSGVTRRVTVQGNTFRTIDAAVDTHGGAEDVTISGNAVITSIDDTSAGVSDHDGIIVQGTRCVVTDNVVRSTSNNTTAGVGIRYQGASTKAQSCVISGNKTFGYKYGIMVDGVATFTTQGGVAISNNYVESPNLTGIYINGSIAAANTLKNVSITGNTIKSPGDRGILVLNATQIAISGNVIDSPAAEGMSLYNNSTGSFSDCTITGNTIKNPTGDGMLIRSGTGVTVSGNSVEVPTNKHAIYFLTTVHGTISGNRILGLSTTGSVGIRLGTTATNVAITGNEVTGVSIGIYFSSADCINNIVSGNVSLSNTTAFNLSTGSPNVVANNIPGVIATVASAATITLPPSENDFYAISGTTNIDTITATSMAGRRITLKFAGILTVGDGTGNCKLSAGFTTTADDTITLACDGTSWYEIARSVN